MPNVPITRSPSPIGFDRQIVENAWIKAVNAHDWTTIDQRIAAGDDPHEIAGNLFVLPHWLSDPHGGGAERLRRWQAVGVDLLRFPLDVNASVRSVTLDVPDTSVQPLLYALERAVRTDAEMAEIVGVLLAAGARWRTPSEEGAVLGLVVLRHGPHTLDALLRNELNPQVHVNDPAVGSQEPGPVERSALHLAAAYGHVAMVRHLTALGLNANQVDPIGNTPLLIALSHPSEHSEGILLALLEAGADPTFQPGPSKSSAQALAETMKHASGWTLQWEAWVRALTAHEQGVLRNQVGSIPPIPAGSGRPRL